MISICPKVNSKYPYQPLRDHYELTQLTYFDLSPILTFVIQTCGQLEDQSSCNSAVALHYSQMPHCFCSFFSWPNSSSSPCPKDLWVPQMSFLHEKLHQFQLTFPSLMLFSRISTLANFIQFQSFALSASLKTHVFLLFLLYV